MYKECLMMINYVKFRNLDKIKQVGQRVHEMYFNNQLPFKQKVKKAGISIKYLTSANINGLIKWDAFNMEPICCLNAKLSESKQEFILAEEIAILMFDYQWFPYSSQNKQFADNKIMAILSDLVQSNEIYEFAKQLLK